jgi:hypothetical protein
VSPFYIASKQFREVTDAKVGVNHGDEDSGVAMQNEAGERKHELGHYNVLHLASSSAASVI